MPACRYQFYAALIGLATLAGLPDLSHARDDPPPQTPRPSATLMGPIGLNTLPSARMDEAGTVRIGAGTMDPYLHSFAGFQLTDSLFIGVRQSAEKSSLGKKPKALYPGLDFKIRLNEEGRYDPEVALGFLSGFGHKKTASEYIALSKRYHDFDFTLGMGWGRLAGDGHIGNPLKNLSAHFGNDRDFTNETPNTIHDWFTGDEAGFFAGLEYHTPISGLSLKADWGANPYTIEEKTIAGYDAPAPWSLGINYAPTSWMEGMVGFAGTDTVMARLSMQSNVMDWLAGTYKDEAAQALTPRSAQTDLDAMQKSAEQNAIIISPPEITDTTASAYLALDSYRPAAYQIGRAARHIANHAGPDIETIRLIPLRGKISGRAVSFSRRDLEQALLHHQGSPEEIWRNASFDEIATQNLPASPFRFNLNFALKNEISISEDDAEYLYRSAALARARGELPWGSFLGADVKLNLSDNLDKLPDLSDKEVSTVRSDIDDYTKRRLYLERAYGGWRREIFNDVFMSATTGLLEEMYAGYGGEILYRPFGKTFALGVDGWTVYKRGSDDFWGIDGADDMRFTGHLNLFYEIPDSGITAYAKAGQYLGGDHGVTLGMDHRFDNGATLGGFVTASREADLDTLGGATNLYSGVQLTIPLGNMPYVPEGSEVITAFRPQGRDAGQILDHPEPLYDATEPVSYRAVSRSWHRLLD